MTISFYFDGYRWKFNSSQNTYYNYSSGHGVGQGSYYASDPDNYRSSFFILDIGDLTSTVVKMLKYLWIFGMYETVDTGIWESVSSCYNPYYDWLFAVGVSGPFDY